MRDAVEDGFRRVGLAEAGIAGEVGMETQLAGLSPGQLERVEELAVALPAAIFRDVAADRDG